ncbi:MAG: TadE/TadG family type IV pilus assembly protein [Pirellulaceae bacterium]
MRIPPRRPARKRRGTVSVEMALVAPALVAIMAGLHQASMLVDAQTQLATAARQGARLATMDRAGLLSEDQSMNDKVTQEVRTFLDASGLPGSQAEVWIVDPVDHTTPFDLDNAANDLKLFELRVELPYAEISGVTSDAWTMTAKVVFRNARSAIVQ